MFETRVFLMYKQRETISTVLKSESDVISQNSIISFTSATKKPRIFNINLYDDGTKFVVRELVMNYSFE